MKSNKVLLGLFVGVLALIGGSLTAQTTFREIGPANVAGHVSSLVVDQRDTNHTTVYAGAIAGGLFMRSENEELLQQLYPSEQASLASNHNTWHKVPCNDNLPITSMVQGPDNTIYIGTGDNTYQVGNSFGRMSVLGKGIYRFNPTDLSFTLVPGTKPSGLNERYSAVKKVDCMSYNGKLYFFAVTGTGIYRWVINSESDWATATPTEVYAGKVDELLLVASRRMAYFSVGNQLYKIGDVTATTPNIFNISSSNSAFAAPNTGIKLATSHTHPNYLYAMVINAKDMMQALYLTTDEQNWSTLTTSTVVPFLTGGGNSFGCMVVDPGNPDHIYIAGSSIWSGEGHIAGSYYQWTKSSLSEIELNYGDYMASVFGYPMYVHSGIHQIVPTYVHDADGNSHMTYYIATDGGVFSTTAFNYYEDINIGLNNIQVNDLAVSPDGTVISGAVSNAALLIESRHTHNAVTTEPTWYDNTTNGFNHAANVIFSGNGGKVAASMFQQVKPTSRRLIMVSNDEGNYGRVYADYLDYTNTQTWTQGSAFVSNTNYNDDAPSIAARFENIFGNIYLWETNHNTIFKDSVHHTIDTLGYVLRKRSGHQNYDTVWMSIDGMTTGAILTHNADGSIDTTAVGTGHGSTFQILAGDKIMINSRANSDYPFEYTFTRSQKAGEKVVAKNPLQSRALIVARDSANPAWWTVQISLRATDFTKVWDLNQAYDQNSYDLGGVCLWYPIFQIRSDMGAQLHMNEPNPHSEEGLRPRALCMSADGSKVYVAVQDILTKESMIVRINGFDLINYYIRHDSPNTRKEDYTRLRNHLQCKRASSTSFLTEDTLIVNGSQWMPRAISSIKLDTTTGTERLLVTFEDYDNSFANFAIVNNCKEANWSLTEMPVSGRSDIPAYCSMVEKTTGDIYVGTSDGVFFRHNNTWNPYTELQGIPVTAMVQQQGSLPVIHSLSHNGINPIKYVFAKTKWPNAMYFGTYGRGIFMDMKYVTDTVNEVADSIDNVGIPTVHTNMGSVKVYPNPVCGTAYLNITSEIAANGTVRIYDLNGRCVAVRQLGTVAEGENTYSISTEGMTKGLYLVNVIIGGYTSATKMMVR